MSIVNEFEKAFNRQDVGALVGCFTGGSTGPVAFGFLGCSGTGFSTSLNA